MKKSYHLLLLAFWLVTVPTFAQQVLLDQPTQAGELTLFPDIQNTDQFYYVVDQPRIALDEQGKPQFSFLNYVKNAEGGASGGGIVHAVVELTVDENALQDAQREIRRTNPSATLVGPVMWRGGTLSLISSFVKADGELSQQVLGIGKAPILDGQKAAVSIQLTQKGAEILWQSFQTPTPDMSISFEMELQGFRAPKNAVIEANFERIYEHKAFGAGLATPYLSADIYNAFDDLRNSGAISITQVGEDEQMAKIIETAYQKLSEMMFQPLGGTGTPSLEQLGTGTSGGANMLDRATAHLQKARDEARQENQQIRAENRQEQDRVNRENERIQQQNQLLAEAEPVNTTDYFAQTGSGRPLPQEQQEERRGGNAIRQVHPEMQPGQVALIPMQRPQLRQEVAVPQLALTASYEMKKTRQQGTYRIDLNKSVSDVITMRFDENFGASTAGCNTCYRQVNLDDPLYQQREIIAFVDGLNAQDFGQYINFVTVSLKKQHEGGEVTLDEIRIDRNNFNQEGNRFALIYGWKNDKNRQDWLNYSYQTHWSFFGGIQLEGGEQRTSAGAINLMPPFLRKTIHIEADPDLLEEAEVRLVQVNLYAKMGEKTIQKQLTLKASQEATAASVDLLLPEGQQTYEYEIEWILAGNERVSSGRKQTSMNTLIVDEVPL